MADQLNETLDKNRENFIGELIKLRDFGIKIRDKLDNLKNLNGSELVDLPEDILKNMTTNLLNKTNDLNSTTLQD